jgi:coenzyme PQQ precursor peptide PqqA
MIKIRQGATGVFHSCFIRRRPKRQADPPDAGGDQMNLSMRHCFDRGFGIATRKILCIATISRDPPGRKDSAGELFVPYYLIRRAEFVRFHLRRAKMAWKAPKIVEVPVGMEINMYACAARK